MQLVAFLQCAFTCGIDFNCSILWLFGLGFFCLFLFQGLVSGFKTSKKISVFLGPHSEIGNVRLFG